MIAVQGGDAPHIGLIELLVFLPGLLLLLTYVFLKIRGRDLLKIGPEPTAAFRVVDGIAVAFGTVLLQALFLVVAEGMGVPSGAWRLLVSYVGPVGLAAVVGLVYTQRVKEHGSRARGAALGVLAFVATYPVVGAVLVAWTRLLQSFGADWQEQSILKELRANLPVFFVVAVVCAPLVEELVFRGLLYPAVKAKVGRTASMVITAALFALVHFHLPTGPAIFVLGLFLAYTYERTGTLAAPVLFHMAFNGWTFFGEVLKSCASGA